MAIRIACCSPVALFKARLVLSRWVRRLGLAGGVDSLSIFRAVMQAGSGKAHDAPDALRWLPIRFRQAAPSPFLRLPRLAPYWHNCYVNHGVARFLHFAVAPLRPVSVGTRAHGKAHNAYMASIRPQGNRYRAFVKVDGRRATKVFDTKRAALAWAQEQEAQLSGKQLPDKTFGDACARYSEEVTESKRGGRWDRIRLARFLREDPITKRRLAALRPADMAAWRDARLKQVKPGTVAREMNLITAVLEIARKEWHWLKVSPMQDVSQPKKPKGRARRIEPHEVEALARAFGVWDALVAETQRNRVGLAFLFALETAMRSGEICDLHWRDIHLQERYVTVRTSKNGDSREVPLTLRAVEILKVLPRGFGPVFGLTAGKRDGLFRKVRDAVPGIKNLHFHDCRAEAIWRLSKKLDVLELARVIGHRNLSSLLIYYRATAAEMAKRLG